MITKFIANGQTYTFPTTSGDQSFKTNFANLVPKTTRLPGLDGGFDEYGLSKAPSEIGSVQFSVVLESETRAGMQTLRDGLRAMVAWGKGRLVDNINGVERWCWARVNNIEMSEQRHLHTDLFQNVQLWFQVSDPYWYSNGPSVAWGAGTWGSSTWGGATAGSIVTTTGNLTITNNGSAVTLARFKFKGTSVDPAYNPRVRRFVAGTVADELAYSGTIASGSLLDIDAAAYTATLDGVSVIDNLTYTYPQWMRLYPGANLLTFYVSGTVTVYVRYLEKFV